MMKRSVILSSLLTLFLSTNAMAASFRLQSHQVNIVNDTNQNVTKAIIRVHLDCKRENLVVGPETISSKKYSKEITLSETDTETTFNLDTASHSCFSVFGKRWISPSITIIYPEIKKMNGFSLNSRDQHYSGSVMNDILASKLNYVSISKAIDTYGDIH